MRNDTNVCSTPFRFCEIHEQGKVLPCCPTYCNNHSFGYIKFKNFEKVWNSKRAKDFREKILNGDYSLCNRELCKAYRPENIQDIKEKYFDKNGKVKTPEEIKMCWDIECNTACITCRDKIKRNSFVSEAIANLIKFNLRNAFKSLKFFNCSGSGDPFGSRYCRKLLKEAAASNPDLRFNICSNGVLMTKKLCKNIGIYNRIDNVTISVHAATKETYNKIVRYGNFDKVLENLEWLAEEKKNNKIKNISLVFVMHKVNYKEIPDFIALSKKYNASPGFSCYGYWGTEFGKDYEDAAVWLPGHPEYNEFLEVLNTPVVKENIHAFQDKIAKLVSAN